MYPGWALTAALLTTLGVIGLWLMDLGSLDAPLCNGWFCISATRVFHLGLYVVVAALLGQLIVFFMRPKR